MNNHVYGDVSNLNAPYDYTFSVQGLGAEDPRYPWMKKSADTQTLQLALNKELKGIGLCPLLVDGIMGPRTCGALARMDMFDWPNISTCQGAPEQMILPKEPPCPGGGSTATGPVDQTDPEEVVRKSGISPMMIALGVGALAIAGVLLLKKKKR